MKKQTGLFVAARIALTALFVMGLLFLLFTAAVSLTISEKAVARALEKQDFAALAVQKIAENVEDLQGIINVETDKILSAVAAETVEKELTAYTDSLTAKLLSGADNLYAVQFDSPALRELVDSAIAPEWYADNPEQMQKDRDAAYAEIVGVIDGQLAFFPLTFIDKMTATVQEHVGITPERFYSAVSLFKKLCLPALLVTVALGAALYFTRHGDLTDALRYVAGVGFVTASAVFLPALFLQRYTLFNRLSLSDGLLRRYILCLVHHVRSALLTPTLCCFLIFLLFLAATLFFSAKKLWKTCKTAENVLP